MKKNTRLVFGFMMLTGMVAGCKGEQVVVRDQGSTCGNGTIETDEGCDDGNTVAGGDLR